MRSDVARMTKIITRLSPHQRAERCRRHSAVCFVLVSDLIHVKMEELLKAAGRRHGVSRVSMRTSLLRPGHPADVICLGADIVARTERDSPEPLPEAFEATLPAVHAPESTRPMAGPHLRAAAAGAAGCTLQRRARLCVPRVLLPRHLQFCLPAKERLRPALYAAVVGGGYAASRVAFATAASGGAARAGRLPAVRLANVDGGACMGHTVERSDRLSRFPITCSGSLEHRCSTGPAALPQPCPRAAWLCDAEHRSLATGP
jgi:hypothetical protein